MSTWGRKLGGRRKAWTGPEARRKKEGLDCTVHMPANQPASQRASVREPELRGAPGRASEEVDAPTQSNIPIDARTHATHTRQRASLLRTSNHSRLRRYVCVYTGRHVRVCADLPHEEVAVSENSTELPRPGEGWSSKTTVNYSVLAASPQSRRPRPMATRSHAIVGLYSVSVVPLISAPTSGLGPEIFCCSHVTRSRPCR